MNHIRNILFIIVVAVMCACSDNNPSSVTEKAFKALNNKDYHALVALMGDADGNKLTTSAAAEAEDHIKSAIKHVDTSNMVITKEESDDNSASIDIITVVNGRPRQIQMLFRKGDDSIWRLVYKGNSE